MPLAGVGGLSDGAVRLQFCKETDETRYRITTRTGAERFRNLAKLLAQRRGPNAETEALLREAIATAGGALLVTADHGNCEMMRDPVTGGPHTAHTTNPVPLILVDAKKHFGTLRAGGVLSNVAPTMLAILGIDKPAEMTAESLLS